MREKILQIAAELFAEYGYDNTSMRQIAERCQITKPALYYYFSDKKSLFIELIHQCQKITAEATQNILESNLEPIEKLKALVESRFYLFKKHPETAKLINIIISGNFPHELHQDLILEIQELFKVIFAVLEEGMSKGIFRTDIDKFDFAAALIGGINIYIARYIKFGIDELNSQKAHKYVETLINGILQRN